MHLAGGRAELVERLAGAEAVLVLDNCEHVVDAVAELSPRAARRHDRAARAGDEPASARGRRRDGLSAGAAADRRFDRAVRRAGRGTRRRFVLDDGHRRDRRGGVPVARRPAAGHRARRSPGPVAVGREIASRLDDRFVLLRDPTSRRPERRVRWPRRSGGATTCCSPTTSAGCGRCPASPTAHRSTRPSACSAALGVPEASAVDVIDRLVDRSLVSVEDGRRRRRPLPTARQHPRLRHDRLARGRALDDARRAHAAWFAEAADRSPRAHRAGAAPAAVPGARTGRAGQHRRRPRLDGRARPGARGADRQRIRLDLGRARRRRGRRGADPWRARAARNHDRGNGPRPAARRMAGGLGRRPRPGPVPIWTVRGSSGIDVADDRLRADAERHLAFLRIQQGRPHDASTWPPRAYRLP